MSKTAEKIEKFIRFLKDYVRKSHTGKVDCQINFYNGDITSIEKTETERVA
jgi:hypothetical protein